MSAQTHQSDVRILGRRTLERDHRALAALLRPGMAVLDVGCGGGAITAGIGRAVGVDGRVLGIDRDAGLIEVARGEETSRVKFQQADILASPFCQEFDVVTAARTLQWIADPGRAVHALVQAAKPGGWVVVLDYNHTANSLQPSPPTEFELFYQAFLDWRAANGWDNQMADHLPELFREAGLVEIASQDQSETASRGDKEFPHRSSIWEEVIENVGGRMSDAGFLTPSQLAAARSVYGQWRVAQLLTQRLELKAITGRVPAVLDTPGCDEVLA